MEGSELGEPLDTVHVLQHGTIGEREVIKRGAALKAIHVSQRAALGEVEYPKRGEAVEPVQVLQRMAGSDIDGVWIDAPKRGGHGGEVEELGGFGRVNYPPARLRLPSV